MERAASFSLAPLRMSSAARATRTSGIFLDVCTPWKHLQDIIVLAVRLYRQKIAAASARPSCFPAGLWRRRLDEGRRIRTGPQYPQGSSAIPFVSLSARSGFPVPATPSQVLGQYRTWPPTVSMPIQMYPLIPSVTRNRRFCHFAVRQELNLPDQESIRPPAAPCADTITLSHPAQSSSPLKSA